MREDLVCSKCGKRLLTHEAMVKFVNAFSKHEIVGVAIPGEDNPDRYASSCCEVLAVPSDLFEEIAIIGWATWSMKFLYNNDQQEVLGYE